LEGQPPIYPFVQVDLESNRDRAVKFVKDGTKPQTRYCLPDPEQLARWQEERDNVEGEVIAFDGGDLERVKQKTRG
jgi:hypothetical protein